MAGPASLVDLGELADSIDAIVTDEARVRDVIDRITATFATGDEVARVWAAILLGALHDGGHKTDRDVATTAAELLAGVARGSVAADVLQTIDELCHAHELFGGAATGLSGARSQALAALGALGPNAAPAIDALVHVLASTTEDEDTRALAADALGSMASLAHGAARVDDPRVMSALTQGLHAKRDSDGTVRAAVLESLARLGSAGRAAVPELRKVLADPKCKYLHELTTETLAAIEAS